MKAPALVLYLTVSACALVSFSVKLHTLTTQVGEEFSHWPSWAAVAGLAECWVLFVLVLVLGVMLEQRGRERERDDPDDETRVTVRTPRAGDHKVSTKVVVTNDPRRVRDDSSEFELTLD